MANRVNVVLKEGGIKVNKLVDRESPMQVIAETADDAFGEEKIWTSGMGPCAAIATYDHTNSHRTLCHSGGGNFTAYHAPYIDHLAGKISEDTTIIFALGTDWAPNRYTDRKAIDDTKRAIEAAMGREGKRHDLLTWIEFWPPAWTVGQQRERGTFVLCRNGKFGEKIKDPPVAHS